MNREEAIYIKEVGLRVRALRKSKYDMSQADFAKHCHLKQSQISDIENGNVDRIDFLLQISLHTDTSIDYFLTGRA